MSENTRKLLLVGCAILLPFIIKFGRSATTTPARILIMILALAALGSFFYLAITFIIHNVRAMEGGDE